MKALETIDTDKARRDRVRDFKKLKTAAIDYARRIGMLGNNETPLVALTLLVNNDNSGFSIEIRFTSEGAIERSTRMRERMRKDGFDPDCLS